MRTILTVAALFLLTSCSNTMPLLWAKPPASLLQPCQPLVLLSDQPKTLGSLNAVAVENYGLYHECRKRHRALAEWLGK